MCICAIIKDIDFIRENRGLGAYILESVELWAGIGRYSVARFHIDMFVELTHDCGR